MRQARDQTTTGNALNTAFVALHTHNTTYPGCARPWYLPSLSITPISALGMHWKQHAMLKLFAPVKGQSGEGMRSGVRTSSSVLMLQSS